MRVGVHPVDVADIIAQQVGVVLRSSLSRSKSMHGLNIAFLVDFYYACELWEGPSAKDAGVENTGAPFPPGPPEFAVEPKNSPGLPSDKETGFPGAPGRFHRTSNRGLGVSCELATEQTRKRAPARPGILRSFLISVLIGMHQDMIADCPPIRIGLRTLLYRMNAVCGAFARSVGSAGASRSAMF